MDFLHVLRRKLIFLHVADAAKHGYRKVMIRTVDSDVLELAIATVQQLSLDELWVGFDSVKSFSYLRWHVLSPQRSAYSLALSTRYVTQYHPLLTVEKALCV